MKRRHTQYLDAMPGSQLLQLAPGGWVLSDIANHDSQGRPVALKVFEKLFGLRAMEAALAGKDFDVRLLPGRLDGGASKREGQGSKDKRQDEEPVCDHDSIATQAVN